MDESLTTIGELWRQTADVMSSRAQARWMCEVAVGRDGDEFDVALAEPVTDAMVAHLDALLARWRQGEPLAYVLGRWGFRHLDLALDRRVLIPRPETEWVAGLAIEKAAGMPAPRVVADLGTGSGAIGLSMAFELPLEGTTVWITDADPDALAVAQANISGIGRAGTNVRVGQGSWYDALPDDLVCDVIVSNPPYVADASPDLDDSVRDWEPAVALFGGPSGYDHLDVIIEGAPRRLSGGGWLIVEIGADQGEGTAERMRAAGLHQVEIMPDLAGHDRIVCGRN